VPELGPDISRSMAALVKKALAKLPADRYQTANDLARALERELEDRRTSGAHLTGLPRRTRQALVAMGGALLLTGFVVGLLASRRPRLPAVVPGNGLLLIDSSPA